jgi:hypothetical protein
MGKRLSLCVAGLMSVSLLPAARSSGEDPQRPPTAPELVQAVRQSENWIHDVNSFYAHFESTGPLRVIQTRSSSPGAFVLCRG